ncbi:hypothetical protein YC2023_015599 [Brassica napus]
MVMRRRDPGKLRISGLFKPDLDLITQSNGYWNRAKVSEREKRRSYSSRGDYRRDEGGSVYRNSRWEPSRGYAQEDRNRFARGSRRETSQLRDVEEDHEEGEFHNKVREVKEDHQGDKEIPQTKNVPAVQMELTLPQIVSYVVILDSIRMEDGVDFGNKMLEEGINGLEEDTLVMWITLVQVYILESNSEVEYGVHSVSALVVGLIKPNTKPGSVQE